MATLAQTYGPDASLRSALRALVGYSNDTVLAPDALVATVVARALAAVNTDYPLISVGTFRTVAGQQIYSPLPANGYAIRRVFWPRACGCQGEAGRFFSSYAYRFSTPIDEFGTRTAAEPGAVIALLRQQRWFRGLEARGATVVGRSVYLDPVPGNGDDDVVFSFSAQRYAGAGEVEELYADAWWARATGLLHEALAAGAGGITDVRDTAEGSAVSTISPEHHLKLAAQKKAEYDAMKPPLDLPDAFP